jgi:hypothetical protein
MDDGATADVTVDTALDAAGGTELRPLAELAREITSGAVRLAAGTAAWLRAVAEFDRRDGWAGVGIQSCAHWLAWQCGMAPGAAREHVRVARALGVLPVTAAAFSAGRLSYSKVRAITRVAEPGTESELVELARHATASQVERVVRAWRRAQAVEDGVVAERRAFAWSWEDDGMLSLRVRLDPEQGAALLAAVESLAERDARRERADAKRRDRAGSAAPAVGDDAVPAAGSPDPDAEENAFPRERMAARRCAALGRLASAAAEADRRAGDPPRREVVVHVDADVLADDAAAGRAHLEGGPALHPARVRRMACTAALTVIVERNGEPLAQGRAKRLATRAQRRALLARDGGCARPGCTETRVERLHAHHLRHWLFGGRTDVSNMVLLCDVDHGLVHDLGLILSRSSGRLVALTPDGRRVWGSADAAFADGLHAGSSDSAFAGVHPIDERTGRHPEEATVLPLAGRRGAGAGTAADVLTPLLPSTPGLLPSAWPAGGERMQLGHVVWALLAHRNFVRRQAA